MGIKHLNKFLRDEAQNSIRFISLSELSGKKIAVDISIYMYKYVSEGTLLENMYLMLSTLRYYNIAPVFIFDGKPPPEKKELLIKRKEDKQDAENEYNKLKKQLENKEIDNLEKQDVINNMDILKKKFIYVSKNDIDNVKELIRAYGASYYDAPGEADELCALLVIKNKVWACLSEDMDMFVYGCARVIRYLSLLNKTAVLYDTKGILNNLGISQKELRQICVISGTDYSFNKKSEITNNTNNDNNDNDNNNPTLHKTLRYFKKYHNENLEIDFYDWLKTNTDYIKDYEGLMKIYSLFELNDGCHKHLKIFENIQILNGPIIKSDIKNIIRSEGFIFPEI
jgi:hypothetical protein